LVIPRALADDVVSCLWGFIVTWAADDDDDGQVFGSGERGRSNI
jgi:hypothetical protein